MARIVCFGRDTVATDPAKKARGWRTGDSVQVFEDGVYLGLDVEPATAPDDTPFVVVEVPGVLRSNLLYLEAEHRTPMFIQNDPNLPEFGEALRNIIARRRYQIDVSRLPGKAQIEWADTRAWLRRVPVRVNTLTLFETAVIDKQFGSPINPSTVPRGKKEHPQVAP